MHVKVVRSGDTCLTIYVDGDEKFEVDVEDIERKDVFLGRCLSDVFVIPDLMELAHEAGKRGEALTIEHVSDEDSDSE